MERVSIYLKQDGEYLFLARAWSEVVSHKGVAHPSVLFEWYTSRLYGQDKVQSAHLTYPDTGDLHLTYIFEGGMTLHLSGERMNLTWPRDLGSPTLPRPEFLGTVSRQLQRRKPPRFDQFTPATLISPVTSAMRLPFPTPEWLRPKRTRKAHWKVLELENFPGSLNLHPVLAGSLDPDLPKPTEPVSFEEKFITGSKAPYFGIIVRVLPGKELSTG